ncbi:ATP-binding cassette domain-containing protein [Acidimicrobiales bacterium]|nr:ATP-binding cassette domain-containing protein [Acidimicrobiales bacterium]MDB4818784.1 ATP-binding cassette domain-containing protein [Acidimicrobiales bacterium]MDG1086244.1 ATP-binding cassette domain-containing protein [Acidimicrobiales bacterium]HAY66916.1 daunorubicin ABC transporter ATP-binding protein [Acidimicrobiaceae bacterium]
MSELVIETSGLKRSFGDVHAVKGVDLAVKSGEIYGFLGPNGAGKSTVVKMLITLLKPTGGTATVFGYDVVEDAPKIRLRIGTALQDASLDEKQSGREILRLQGALYGLTRSETDTRIDELSSLIDVEAIDRWIGTYSGGMRRRLDLAASLMHSPDLLFLDEPTTGLDPQSRAQVWKEVRALNTELGTTIFLTTQYLEEADELADRVGIINDGLIVGEGTPEDLKRAIGADVIQIIVDDTDAAVAALEELSGVDHVERGPRALLVSVKDGAATVSPVVIALDNAGVDIGELTLRTPTLDDVFLELTGDRIEVSQ